MSSLVELFNETMPPTYWLYIILFRRLVNSNEHGTVTVLHDLYRFLPQFGVYSELSDIDRLNANMYKL